ncbi:hypothetical protein GJ633_15650, partial [Halorubrum sp. CBA1125]|nr:hypothetical protein [Halorubrum sp. CBA1125]
MAKQDPAELVRLVDAFPAAPSEGATERGGSDATAGDDPGTDGSFARVDELLDGTYGALTREWYPELRRRVSAYADGDCLRERVLAHVESVPSFRLSDGATPLADRRAALAEAAAVSDDVAAVAEWYGTLRARIEDDPASLTRFERLLHGFGYALAHGLFLGASSPAAV